MMMLKRLLGWLVNFFPNNVFYADTFLPDLRFTLGDVDGDDIHNTGGNTAAVAVAVAASRLLKSPGAEITMEFTAVHHAGRDVGSYKINIERLSQ